MGLGVTTGQEVLRYILLFATLGACGTGMAFVDTGAMPTLGDIVDWQQWKVGSLSVMLVTSTHAPPFQTYGSVYALSDMATCTGLALGPLIGPPLARVIGYELTFIVFAAASLVFLPATLLLRGLPRLSSEEGSKQSLLEDTKEDEETGPVLVRSMDSLLHQRHENTESD
jgi:MFS family permease